MSNYNAYSEQSNEMRAGRRFARPVIAAMALGAAMIVMTTSAKCDSSLSASPIEGAAPLVVTFTGTGSGSFEGLMALDFGDGQTDDSISTIRDFTRTHSYAAPGIYLAVLKAGTYGGQRPTVFTAVAKVRITVR